MGGLQLGSSLPKGQEVSAPHRKHRTKTNFSQGRILPSFPDPNLSRVEVGSGGEQSSGGEWGGR